MSFIVRDDPHHIPPTSTAQDTTANAPAVAPTGTPFIIEEVARSTLSINNKQVVESAKESQGRTPEPLPISASKLVDGQEKVPQSTTSAGHTPGTTEGAHVQTSSSRPVSHANSEHVPNEDIQEGQPDTEHKPAEATPKDQQPTPLPETVHEAAKDAEQIKSVCDRLGNSVYYLKGVMKLGQFVSEVSSDSS